MSKSKNENTFAAELGKWIEKAKDCDCKREKVIYHCKDEKCPKN